jgi:hypothetical protein
MAEQAIPRDEMQARRELLTCRACGGVIWHFHAQEASSATGPVILIGYHCAGCDARIDVLMAAPASAAEADGAG